MRSNQPEMVEACGTSGTRSESSKGSSTRLTLLSLRMRLSWAGQVVMRTPPSLLPLHQSKWTGPYRTSCRNSHPLNPQIRPTTMRAPRNRRPTKTLKAHSNALKNKETAKSLLNDHWIRATLLKARANSRILMTGGASKRCNRSKPMSISTDS